MAQTLVQKTPFDRPQPTSTYMYFRLFKGATVVYTGRAGDLVVSLEYY